MDRHCFYIYLRRYFLPRMLLWYMSTHVCHVCVRAFCICATFYYFFYYYYTYKMYGSLKKSCYFRKALCGGVVLVVHSGEHFACTNTLIFLRFITGSATLWFAAASTK